MNEDRVVPREGPGWVDAFLSGEYFTNCNVHKNGKNERNHFCTDCNEGPLCHFGLAQLHAHHRTLQVRKASHMDSIRVIDIQRCLEVSDIQTYSINSAKIVFLLSRPQPRPSKGAVHACRCCNRALSDDVRFCSIACKLDVLRAVRNDDSITFAVHPSAMLTMEPDVEPAEHLPELREDTAGKANGKKRKVYKRKKFTEKRGFKKKMLLSTSAVAKESYLGDGLLFTEGDSPATPEKFDVGSSSKSRCRKGVPRRAPLG